jgi:signal transduction histidine kinase
MVGDPTPPPGTPEEVRLQAFLGQAVYLLVAAVLLSAVMRAMQRTLDHARREAEIRLAAIEELRERQRLVERVLGERQRAEEDLREAQARREQLIRELEAKNAELESFTYTVSHDLKSPLVTLKGFLAYLLRDLRAGETSRLEADAARIQGAAEKMEQLLRELLELSRVGRVVNPPQEMAFSDVVREALFLSQGRLAARGVAVEVAPDLPAVWGDRARLVQVVQNLVDNAVKFMGDEKAPRIEIGTRAAGPGEMPVFFVRDNGIGIEPAYHEAVFGLFRRLDPRAEGSGVGLALVRRIVEVHGGRAWVESEGPGKGGSTFCFTLAARRTPPNGRAADREPPPQPREALR